MDTLVCVGLCVHMHVFVCLYACFCVSVCMFLCVRMHVFLLLFFVFFVCECVHVLCMHVYVCLVISVFLKCTQKHTDSIPYNLRLREGSRVEHVVDITASAGQEEEEDLLYNRAVTVFRGLDVIQGTVGGLAGGDSAMQIQRL